MDEQPKRVSPFFRQALPPDPLPLLTSQMSLGKSTRHAGILSNEEFPPPGPHRGIAVHEALVSIASVSAVATSPRSVAVSCRDQSDCSKGGVLESFRGSELESDGWSERGESEREGRPHKIPKPRGEVGRPQWGYNLKAAMGWNGDEYERLRVREILKVLGFSSHVFPGYCHETWEHLDVTSPLTRQDPEKLRLVRGKVRSRTASY